MYDNLLKIFNYFNNLIQFFQFSCVKTMLTKTPMPNYFRFCQFNFKISWKSWKQYGQNKIVISFCIVPGFVNIVYIESAQNSLYELFKVRLKFLVIESHSLGGRLINIMLYSVLHMQIRSSYAELYIGKGCMNRFHLR